MVYFNKIFMDILGKQLNSFDLKANNEIELK